MRSLFLLRLVLPLAIVCGLRGADPDRSDPGQFVGVYHWGGYASQTIAAGAQQIGNLGARVARVAISPRYALDYHLGDSCITPFSLSEFVRRDDVAGALANPQLRVVMLTVYDGTSYPDCKSLYVNPSFYTAENSARIRQEYSDFVVTLYQMFRGSGKRFILSNWEGDNTVYCGSAFLYAADRKFRASCDSNYQATYGTRSRDEVFWALEQWFRLRQSGIEDGIARAAALGLAGMEVLHAPEFNIVRTLGEHGLPSVLHDLLPRLHPQMVSYSAWETMGRAEPEAALAQDMDTIRQVLGPVRVILGEIGWRRSEDSDRDVTYMAGVIGKAAPLDIEYMIVWQLNDQDPANQFGLYDLSGKLTKLGSYLQETFSATRPKNTCMRAPTGRIVTEPVRGCLQ